MLLSGAEEGSLLLVLLGAGVFGLIQSPISKDLPAEAPAQKA
jgi:hypothetical protein